MDAQSRPKCDECFHRDQCLPSAGLQLDWQLAALVEREAHVGRGDVLSRRASPEGKVFVIKVGAFRSESLLASGAMRVLGLHEAGDFMAIEALLGQRPAVEHIALRDSVVCVLSADKLETMGHVQPSLERYLEHLAGGALAQAYRDMFSLGRLSTDERLAHFLVELSDRRRMRGRSPVALDLPFTRGDIGAHLAVRLETISRSFGNLERLGLLRRKRAEVEILDLARLRSFAGAEAGMHDRRARPSAVGARIGRLT